MDEPPVPAARPTPAAVPRRRRGRTILVVAALIATALGLRAVFYVAGQVMRQEQLATMSVQEMLNGGNLYTLMAGEHRKDPTASAAFWQRRSRDSFRNNVATAGIQVDRAAVDDLGWALRIVSVGRGPMVISGETAPVVLESRQYFHAHGLDLLTALCLTELHACGDRAALVERAERALRGRLAEGGITGFLPDGGTCAPIGTASTATKGPSVSCGYPSGTRLTLNRKREAETRTFLREILAAP
jgi:hypothetical protein